MTPEDYKWHIEMVQGRYSWLQLTYEQAEQVYQYEQEMSLPGTMNFFSNWEEWDYEWTTFRQFLQPDQWAIYEKSLQENKAYYEQQLMEDDQNKLHDVDYHSALLHFYETQFLPSFFDDRSTLLLVNAFHERTKIDYLRAEYKHYLAERKREILTAHFRHSKTLQPNHLKLSLLQHSIAYVRPGYHSFKHEMDQPTKTMAQYLYNRFSDVMAGAEELLIQQEKEVAAFNESLRKKYYTDDTGGWHVSVGITEEELKEDRMLTLILLDSNKYGLQRV